MSSVRKRRWEGIWCARLAWHAQFKIGMMNLVYNMKRLRQLLKRDAQRLLCPGPRSDLSMAA